MLFKLTRKGETDWDEYRGFVVRAKNEYEARELASKEDNSCGGNLWTHPGKTDCEAIDPNGPPEVILEDFIAG